MPTEPEYLDIRRGLGTHAASIIQALAIPGVQVHAFGPRSNTSWPYGTVPLTVHWYESPTLIPSWRQRYTSLRWNHGRLVFLNSRRLGLWAASQIRKLRPEICYVFSEIGQEALNWAANNDVDTVLDTPTTHLRRFRTVRQKESHHLCHSVYRGHPSHSMISRVEREYKLTQRIRVSSRFVRESLIAHDLSPQKIFQAGLPINLDRFKPPTDRATSTGPLRVCFVGSFDLGKGFTYLLRAIRKMGTDRFSLAGCGKTRRKKISAKSKRYYDRESAFWINVVRGQKHFFRNLLEMVGATGDRCCRRLLEEEGKGITLTHGPGDPLPAYNRAEVFVLPSLNDGFGFVAAEAMACGLPVIVTDQCGVAEHVRHGQTGWVVTAGSTGSIAEALDIALRNRKELESMGQLARQDIIKFAGPECLKTLRELVLNRIEWSC